MKRVLSTAALAGVLVFAGGNAAMAATYPAPVPAVAVSDGTVQPGEPFTFSGNGFTPGELVNITATNESPAASGFAGGGNGGRAGAAVGAILPLERQSLTATADAQGRFSQQIVLNETGTYTVTATGAQSKRTQSATVTVVDPALAEEGASGAAGTNLANTGADALLAWGAAGVLALGAGAASVILVRRKASETSVGA